ncbi:MAG: hypothetical protein AXW17_07110 [Colwellia sp. Phe_37]|nr:MAG: hypothetical protein AXW17_07110 [Colwellia sp. Phe_37]
MNIKSYSRSVLKQLFNYIQLDKHFEELLKEGAVSFCLKILGMLVSYASVLWIANYYGAAELGRYTLATTILGIAILVPKFGLDQSLVRIIGELFIKGNLGELLSVFKKAIALAFVLSGFISTLLYLDAQEISIWIGSPKSESTIVNISYAVTPMVLLTIFSAAVQGLKKTYRYTIMVSVLVPGFFLIALVVKEYLAVEVDSVELYVWSVFLSAFVGFIICYRLISFKHSRIKSERYLFKDIVKTSFPMLLSTSFMMIMTWADIIMLSYYNTESEIGVYSAAQRVAALTSVTLMVINAIAAPKYVQFYIAKDMLGFAKYARQSTKLMFYTSLPILILIFSIPKTIMLVFGEEFVSGLYVLLFMGVAQAVNSMSGSVGYIMQMTDNQKMFQRVIFVAAILNIFLNYKLIPLYGINGAAFASMVSLIFWNVALVIIIKIKLGFYTLYVPFLDGAND